MPTPNTTIAMAAHTPPKYMIRAMAKAICSNAPIAVKTCKDAINRGMQVDIDKAIEIEAGDFGSCFDSLDQKEGMSAFLERREKNFQNK